METSVGAAAVTVSGTPGDAIAPSVAAIDVEPTPTAVASPCEPLAPLMVAMAVLEELQVTDAVRTCVDLSLYVPVAVNCCVAPVLTVAVAGVTAIDTKAGAGTTGVVDDGVPPLPPL
jgi:hypothetical protein